MQTKAQAKEEPESPTKGGRKKKGDEQEEEVWKWWVLVTRFVDESRLLSVRPTMCVLL